MTDIGSTPRGGLYGELAIELRDMLIRGELKPGDKISEQALCARFGVSRTPLREALKVLVSEGLLILSPNRGASVARISASEIDELFPIMGIIEGLAGELACARATASDIAQLQATHDAMLEHYRNQDAVAYLKLNREIHEAFFRIAKNNELTQLYQSLIVRTHAIRFIAQKSPQRWREVVEDHEQMMEALWARDGARLNAILRKHMFRKAVIVHEAMASLTNGEEDSEE